MMDSFVNVILVILLCLVLLVLCAKLHGSWEDKDKPGRIDGRPMFWCAVLIIAICSVLKL